MKFGIDKLPEYISWYESLTSKFQAQVEKRLSKIEMEEHFGSTRNLGWGLAELKFGNGVRIYYARTGQNKITLLLGGNKNGQDQDIQQSRRLLDQ